MPRCQTCVAEFAIKKQRQASIHEQCRLACKHQRLLICQLNHEPASSSWWALSGESTWRTGMMMLQLLNQEPNPAIKHYMRCRPLDHEPCRKSNSLNATESVNVDSVSADCSRNKWLPLVEFVMQNCTTLERAWRHDDHYTGGTCNKMQWKLKVRWSSCGHVEKYRAELHRSLISWFDWIRDSREPADAKVLRNVHHRCQEARAQQENLKSPQHQNAVS